MRKKILLITTMLFVFLAAAVLSACAAGSVATEAPTQESAAEVQVEPTPTETPTEVPAASPAEDSSEGEPSGSAAEEPLAEMMVFTDDRGNVIEMAEYPQAIVSLSPSITEILFAIGAGGQIVGRDEFSLYPEAALSVASIGSMFGELPVESILALEPDLIIAAQIISDEQVTALTDLGLNVYWQANPENFAGLYANLQALGALTGHESDADALISDLSARVDAVQEQAASLSFSPSVYYELDATDPANPWTTGTGTFIDYIITLAGGTNAAAALAGDYVQISSEELIEVDPDVILLGNAVYGITPESVAERAGWEGMMAVQTGSVLPVDPSTLSAPGPRLVDGLEAVFELIHPMAEDGRGTVFQVVEPYDAVVSISPSTTEILFAVGAADQVVGRDDFSLYPDAALDVPSVGSLFGELPVEAILALEPDLVVAAQTISAEQVQALEDLGLTVFWQANPDDFEALYENLFDLAALTGHRMEANALIADLKMRVAEVTTTISEAEETPKVFYELDATDPSNPWTTGSGTFIDYIIALAGGENAAAEVEGDYAQISTEALITVDPDVILLGDALYGVTIESVSERPGWDVMSAVQKEAIFPIDPNIMSVPGPRLVDALEETARLLHPGLFE